MKGPVPIQQASQLAVDESPGQANRNDEPEATIQKQNQGDLNRDMMEALVQDVANMKADGTIPDVEGSRASNCQYWHCYTPPFSNKRTCSCLIYA